MIKNYSKDVPKQVMGGRIQRTLFIRLDQILADVATQIMIVSDFRTQENGNPLPVLNNAAEKYEVQLIRWVDKYLNNAKQRMAAYVVTEDRHAVMNAKRPWDEVHIHLAFPSSWRHTGFEALADAVHQYIVNSVLCEFFSLAFTSKDPLVIDKQTFADEANQNIKHYCVSQVPGASKKTLEPF